MSTSTETSPMKKSFTATATLAAYTLVKLLANGSVTTATQATSGEVVIGFTDRQGDQGKVTPISLINGGGSVFATAAATVTTADAVYPGSGGTVDVTASGSVVGYALQDAVAGDVIEVLLA